VGSGALGLAGGYTIFVLLAVSDTNFVLLAWGVGAAVIAIALGIATRVLAGRDLRGMASNRTDPEGRALTQAAAFVGRLGGFFGVFFLLLCALYSALLLLRWLRH